MEERIERQLTKQKTSMIVMICIIIMVGMIGYTYSFFTAEISSESGEITGEVESMNLQLTVSKIAPASPNANKKLVPQLDRAITKAVVGTQGSCVDDNINAVCQVYRITVKNMSGSTVYVDGKLELNASNNPNLKWARISGPGTSSEPTLESVINEHEEVVLTSNELYTGNQTKTYYIVLWISETGYAQMDRGTFTGTVRFGNLEDHSQETLEMLNLTLSDGIPDFNTIAPVTLSYKEADVTTGTQNLSTTNSQYYVTYSDSYTFDTTTGKYMLINLDGSAPSISQYPNIYASLKDKYIVAPGLNANSTIAGYTNLKKIYKVTEATYDSSATTGVIKYDTLTWDEDELDTSQDGMFKAEDDLGTSYYYRGNVENNYVKFGKNSSNQDMYWRIIRINGDGTIRMIYDGTQAHANGVKSSDRQVGVSAFNSNSNSNGYVGYMYGATLGSTYELEHSNDVNSTIKTYLEGSDTTDGWYKDNIIDTGYSHYVADAIYCNDRNNDSGIGVTKTNYPANSRLIHQKIPTLYCARKDDKFTISELLGNGKNKYPVGLITADEAMFAGGISGGNNYYYYLYTGNWYYTMTPSHNDATSSYVFRVTDEGNLQYYVVSVNQMYGVRPVISLKSKAIKYGTGTITDPFRVE